MLSINSCFQCSYDKKRLSKKLCLILSNQKVIGQKRFIETAPKRHFQRKMPIIFFIFCLKKIISPNVRPANRPETWCQNQAIVDKNCKRIFKLIYFQYNVSWTLCCKCRSVHCNTLANTFFFFNIINFVYV